MGGSRLRRRRRGNHGDPPHPPRPLRPPPRTHHRDTEPPQTFPLDRPLLRLPTPRHLLEVRNSSLLCRLRGLYALRASPAPEIDHQESEERVVDWCRLGLVLDLVCGYGAGGEGRGVGEADREDQGEIG
ncbi:hypothetical protein Droror1_Dr00019137 [Drosera rotundifolia]